MGEGGLVGSETGDEARSERGGGVEEGGRTRSVRIVGARTLRMWERKVRRRIVIISDGMIGGFCVFCRARDGWLAGGF